MIGFFSALELNAGDFELKVECLNQQSSLVHLRLNLHYAISFFCPYLDELDALLLV
jgi:hypothetical protein